MSGDSGAGNFRLMLVMFLIHILSICIVALLAVALANAFKRRGSERPFHSSL
jgi:hypothetical protein